MSLLTSDAAGVFPVAVTPFRVDGGLDIESIVRLLDFYGECGAAGVTVLGVMGEAAKLDHAEMVTVTHEFLKRAGKLPIIVGVSSPGFASMRALTREAMDAGAAAVMIAPPAAMRTEEQVVAYYSQAVEAIGTDVPFVLQDHPLVTQVVMTANTVRRIVADHPSCIILKHEDWPGLEKLSALRGFEREGSMRRISILCGNGGLFIDFELARGADGAMTGYAFPEALVSMYRLHLQGRRDAAQDVFDLHLPLIRYEHQSGIGLAARKYVLMRRGVIASDTLRKPGTQLGEAARAEIEFLLRRIAARDPNFKV